MVVPHKALQPRWKSANVSTDWLAQVAVSARPKRNGVMMRCRRQNFTSVPQALSRGSENTHWNLSATMLSCPWSIWDSFRCLYSNTPTRSFGWIAIKIHNKIKYLKVPTYVCQQGLPSHRPLHLHLFRLYSAMSMRDGASSKQVKAWAMAEA